MCRALFWMLHIFTTTLGDTVTFIPVSQIRKFMYRDINHIAHKCHKPDLSLDSLVPEFMFLITTLYCLGKKVVEFHKTTVPPTSYYPHIWILPRKNKQSQQYDVIEWQLLKIAPFTN